MRPVQLFMEYDSEIIDMVYFNEKFNILKN